jgi:hypothetical protein
VSFSFVVSLVILLWFSLASIEPSDSDRKVALTGRFSPLGGLKEVFTLPHQFLVESSGILRIPRNPRNEPGMNQNLKI